MEGFYERTQAVLGEQGLNKIKNAKVMVIGLGGVGSFVAEALARSGVGELCLVDGDTVCDSNINRQLYALLSTKGQYKCDIAAARIADINPNCKVTVIKEFISSENIDCLKLSCYDFVADAIDDVSAKVEIICAAMAAKVEVISCMGTGNKLHPEKLCVADISKTNTCPLARAVRYALRQKGISKGVRTVYSAEEPLKNDSAEIGSISFVPSAAGLMIASVIVRHIAGVE